MKRLVILLIGLMGIANALSARNVKRPDTYNYNRGVEALQNENMEEASEYLGKELEENPDNGYAWAWMAVAHMYQEEYGKALTAANVAVQKVPKKDGEGRAAAYYVRALVYMRLGEVDNAFSDMAAAIKEAPEEVDPYEVRAVWYYEQGEYELSDKDYQKIISIDPGNVLARMGIGVNANAEKRYEDAIEQFDYVAKLVSTDYSSVYSYRAESYIGLGRYDEAIDDIIHALDIDYDQKAFYLMLEVADSAKIPLVGKLKIQSDKNPNSDFWPYCLGMVYEQADAYKEAIPYYMESMEKEASPITAYRISCCYQGLGDFVPALEYIDKAIALDSTDYDNVQVKAGILYDLGNVPAAIAEITKYITRYPDDPDGYYQRAWFKDNSRDYKGAIEDYTTSLILEPSHFHAYLHRGNAYRLIGDTASAQADFRKVVEMDTVPGSSSCAQFALLELGQKEKAIEFMDIILAHEPDDGNYYNAACLYSRMGEVEKALEFLRTALEKGYHDFAHMEMDDDLDNVRQLPAFMELIRQYKEAAEAEHEDGTLASNITYEERIAEIPFSKEGDLYRVKCTINNLPLHFLFDTGASTVSISSVEAAFMLKNGYLNSTDMIGKQNYMMANGEISEGTVINLRRVGIGNLSLENVRASVVHNQRAPLLLGQSVLGRLGNIEIDNAKGLLRITYQEEVKID